MIAGLTHLQRRTKLLDVVCGSQVLVLCLLVVSLCDLYEMLCCVEQEGPRPRVR